MSRARCAVAPEPTVDFQLQATEQNGPSTTSVSTGLESLEQPMQTSPMSGAMSGEGSGLLSGPQADESTSKTTRIPTRVTVTIRSPKWLFLHKI